MNPTDYELYNENRLALKPCPFCGSEPRVLYLDDDFEETEGYTEQTMYAAVHCQGCCAAVMQMILIPEEVTDAVVRWNRRV